MNNLPQFRLKISPSIDIYLTLYRHLLKLKIIRKITSDQFSIGFHIDLTTFPSIAYITKTLVSVPCPRTLRETGIGIVIIKGACTK